MSERPLARYGAVLGVCALAGGLSGAVVGIVTATRPEGDPGSAVLIAAAVALGMGLGLWASLKWWRGLDEAAQEAHKWAWWWGSTIGLAFAGVGLTAFVYGPGEALNGPAKGLLMTGAGLVTGCQIVGYSIAWAVWWLKRR